MKKLLMAVILSVAAVMAVSPAFAEETLCASATIDSIAVAENSDNADVVVTATLASGQEYTLPLASEGNLQNAELGADLLAQEAGVIGNVDICVIYNLIPFSGRIISVVTPGIL